MHAASPITVVPRTPRASVGELRESTHGAREHLARCDLCAFECGVNRLNGERGRCRADDVPRVFAQNVLLGEELCLVPSFGVRPSGCNLQCAYCSVWEYSQDPGRGQPLDPETVSRSAQEAQRRGCTNVHLVGGEPTIFLPGLLELAAHLPPTLPLVLNTNLYWSEYCREMLRGAVDVWVVDMRCGRAECCARLGAPGNYVAVAQSNLAALGPEETVVLRHLALPGHVSCCARAVYEAAEACAPWVILSPWLEYFPPPPSQAAPDLCRPLTTEEWSEVADLVSRSRLSVVGASW